MSAAVFLRHALRFLLGLFLLLAGISHLTVQRTAFSAQVPQWLPQDPAFVDFVVLASGVVEILLGLALLLSKRHRKKTGIAVAVFFVLIFPGNISQYTNGIDAFGLDTDLKRLIRLLFQPVLIGWALWVTGALHTFQRKKKESFPG